MMGKVESRTAARLGMWRQAGMTVSVVTEAAGSSAVIVLPFLDMPVSFFGRTR